MTSGEIIGLSMITFWTVYGLYAFFIRPITKKPSSPKVDEWEKDLAELNKRLGTQKVPQEKEKGKLIWSDLSGHSWKWRVREMPDGRLDNIPPDTMKMAFLQQIKDSNAHMSGQIDLLVQKMDEQNTQMKRLNDIMVAIYGIKEKR